MPPVPVLQRIDPLDRSQDERLGAWNAVFVAADRAVNGDQGSPWTTDEIREFHRSPNRRRISIAAVEGHQTVGALQVQLPLRENLDNARLLLAVHPDHRRRGVGTLLLDEGERLAAEAGRTVLLAETEWRQGDEDVSGAHFAVPHGYQPAQTMLRSDLRLPLDRAETGALAAGAGGDYAIETSWDGIPQEWLEDRAVLARRMSTDVPLGELRLEEEDWDAERVRGENQVALDAGRRLVESVARHVPSGRLVGYTEISVSAGSPDVGIQGDTLVMREHRGHGLGLRLKAANALALMDGLPGITTIRTWNAEENEHMLAVNRRLGFAVQGMEREWQKVVRRPRLALPHD
jgi:GNAT superfamily N-acetyltransferase